MAHSAIEEDLGSVDRLISRATPGAPAPLAFWREKLEGMLASGTLIPAERVYLVSIIARMRALEYRTIRPVARRANGASG